MTMTRFFKSVLGVCFVALSIVLVMGRGVVFAQQGQQGDDASMVQAEQMVSAGQEQGTNGENTPETTGGHDASEGEQGDKAGDLDPNLIPSLVFTYWEHSAIIEAKNSRGLARPLSESELRKLTAAPEAEKVKPPPEERYVSLSGIVYVSSRDWTIWLNGERVTPDALPPEAINLKVFKEYIEIKWLDDYTNQIFPIRLRPHQRFNIDTRIFLPGTSSKGEG